MGRCNFVFLPCSLSQEHTSFYGNTTHQHQNIFIACITLPYQSMCFFLFLCCFCWLSTKSHEPLSKIVNKVWREKNYWGLICIYTRELHSAAVGATWDLKNPHITQCCFNSIFAKVEREITLKYAVYLRLSKIIRENTVWCLFWNTILQLTKWSMWKRKTNLWKIILCRIAYISGARKSCQSATSFASLGVRDKRQHMRSRKIAPDWWSSDV